MRAGFSEACMVEPPDDDATCLRIDRKVRRFLRIVRSTGKVAPVM